MIIECEHCNTKFRLDDSRIKPNGVKVRCTKCQNVFIVTPPPPPEEVQVEELFGVSAPFERPQQTPAQPEPEDERPGHGEAAAQAEPQAPFAAAPAEGKARSGPDDEPRTVDDAAAEAPDISFSGPDFNSLMAPKGPEENGAEKPAGVEEGAFGDDARWFDMDKGEPEGSDAKARASAPTRSPVSPASPASDDGLFPSFDDEPEKEDAGTEQAQGPAGLVHEADSVANASVETEEEPPAPEGFDFGFDEEEKEQAGEPTATEEERAAREEFALTPPPAPQPPSEPRPSDEKVIPFSAGYNRNGRPASKSAPRAGEEGRFEDLFTRTLSEAPKEPPADLGIDDDELDEREAAPAPRTIAPHAAPGARGLLLAVLIFIIGGGAVYFSGIIDTVARTLAPSKHAASGAVQIESISAYTAENRNFGKFFVIEARIKNTSDEAQPIKAITGVVYNGRGKSIATRSVSPGRVASPEDLKNLTKQDLLNQFRDSSGGVIPPRGTVPVMVPFTEMPAGMAEYGIDIIRN